MRRVSVRGWGLGLDRGHAGIGWGWGWELGEGREPVDYLGTRVLQVLPRLGNASASSCTGTDSTGQ